MFCFSLLDLHHIPVNLNGMHLVCHYSPLL